jgi:hypothetical protein
MVYSKFARSQDEIAKRTISYELVRAQAIVAVVLSPNAPYTALLTIKATAVT